MPGLSIHPCRTLILLAGIAFVVALAGGAPVAAQDAASAQADVREAAADAAAQEEAKSAADAPSAQADAADDDPPRGDEQASGENKASDQEKASGEEKASDPDKASGEEQASGDDQRRGAEQADDAEDRRADRARRGARRTPPPSGPASYPKLPSMGSTNSDPIPGTPWRVHDLFRPRPPVVTPGEVDSTKHLGTTAPSDAIVLFDGTDLSQWAHRDADDPAVMYPPRWTVRDGYMEVAPGSGSLYTIDSFGSCQLHIEWATPPRPQGSSQGRGNSGIKFFGLYEVQVLDSYDNRTYADGQAGAIYGQFPPDVNASRPPGQWQSYDILFNAPQFDGGKLVRPAVVTVIHNGVAVHHARELKGVARGGRAPVYGAHPPAGQIMLQDHGNPTRFRNIWIRPLD